MADQESTRRLRKRPTAKADYEVGYAKPPSHTQFQKGRTSANPKGRPKGSTSAAALTKALDKEFRVTKNGKIVKMTARDIMTAKQVEAAMKGDVAAFKLLSQVEFMFNKLAASRGPTAEELLLEQENKKRIAKSNEDYLNMVQHQFDFLIAMKKMGLGRVMADGSLGLSRYAARMGSIHPGYRSYPLSLDPKLKAIWDALHDYFGEGNWE